MREGPEHRFQTWTSRCLDKVLPLDISFHSGLDMGAQLMTDNARARAANRGLKSGLPDIFVCQGQGIFEPGLIKWIELKRGSTVSDNQRRVHQALLASGHEVSVCRTVPEVIAALMGAGFQLHGNALNIANEYEARCIAGEKAPRETKASRIKRHVRRRSMSPGRISRMIVNLP